MTAKKNITLTNKEQNNSFKLNQAEQGKKSKMLTKRKKVVAYI